MSLSSQYAQYLRHFGRTVPVCELVQMRDVPDVVALRHDVDYNLDVALELAFWESRFTCRATYYLLHTAPYWHDPRLLEVCLQLQDFGHEVGLHVNLLAQWYAGEIDDVGAELERLISFLRRGGVRISGISAHGDARCYDGGFTNYWLFEELRPDNPHLRERQMTAEGIRAANAERRIDYPANNDQLMRSDGAHIDFWCLKLEDFGLDYEASRVPAEHYYSDSGGYWKRTPDPLMADLTCGRHLVLMHPIHWKGSQHHYYFLSTARSGSKWLAEFLDKATSAVGRHEFTLNHRIEGVAPKLDKRTGAGFCELARRPDEASALIREAREWSETLCSDYAEANVYLEQFIDQMPKDEATLYVHLHRDPKAVVRSLWQRGWYAVPFDDRHPPVDVKGWNSMSQFEQICWYVRDVNTRLAATCKYAVNLEVIARDRAVLADQLVALGIAVYPRFAGQVSNGPVNATEHWDIEPYESWSLMDRNRFDEICGPIAVQLGYSTRTGDALHLSETVHVRRELPDVLLLADTEGIGEAGAVAVRHCALSPNEDPFSVTFAGGLNAYLMLGGGYFHGEKGVWDQPLLAFGGSSKGFPPFGGWWTSSEQIHTVELTVEFEGRGHLRLLCLSYDAAGVLLGKRDIGTLRAPHDSLRRHFRAVRSAKTFNLVLLKGGDEDVVGAHLKSFKLTSHTETRSAGISPQRALSVAGRRLEPWSRVHLISGIRKMGDILARSSRDHFDRWNVTPSIGRSAITLTRPDPNRAGYLFLGTYRSPGLSSAARTKWSDAASRAWPVNPGDLIRGVVQAHPKSDEDTAHVRVLCYAGSGSLLATARVGVMSRTQPSVSFHAVMPSGATHCNVALVMSSTSTTLQLEDVVLERVTNISFWSLVTQQMHQSSKSLLSRLMRYRAHHHPPRARPTQPLLR